LIFSSYFILKTVLISHSQLYLLEISSSSSSSSFHGKRQTEEETEETPITIFLLERNIYAKMCMA